MAEGGFPKRINRVYSNKNSSPGLPFATGNPEKARELKALGLRVDPRSSIKPIEIQGDPRSVLEAKARDAYFQNGGPIIIEDTSMDFDAWGQLPGSYAKDFLAERVQREVFAKALPSDNRGATFRVGLAIYDGQEVQVRLGEARGTIASIPQGPARFAFDDIFIPYGQLNADGTPIEKPRTYAEMSPEEKNQTSARAKAYRSLIAEPFIIQGQVFELFEPTHEQMHFIQREVLGANPQAVQFAFGLESLSGVTPNKELHIEESLYLKPIHTKSYAHGVVREYTANPDSASQGIVIVPAVDLKTIIDTKGNQIAVRLDVDASGDPIFGQMGIKRTEMALASRCREFLDMHNDTMHKYIRQLIRGEIPIVKRSNTRSPVLEDLLGISVQKDTQGNVMLTPARGTIAVKELGYKRLSDTGILSRKEASLTGTLLLGPDGVPSSLFALGGMPPVTGSRDVLVAAALSYMKSWIPHNGVFAGNFNRQLALFKESRDQIKTLGLPEDIEDICIKQIGITFGSEKPEVIAQQVRRYQEAGGHAARIYTTNPDRRIIETAKAIRDAVGEDFLLCVGPVTDYDQAVRLKREANVQMFLAGHGGGENCTSLTAGGAANSIEILYAMYLDPLFNDCIIGLEGGTGETIGALLPMLDVISLNKRGIGGIEPGQGLYVRKTSKGIPRYVQPYHGSASAVTQITESAMDEDIARRRLGLDGKVRAVEGKPNYRVLADKESSVVDAFAHNRAIAGLALADQQSLSLYMVRDRVRKYGHNHVGVSPASSEIAGEHRSTV